MSSSFCAKCLVSDGWPLSKLSIRSQTVPITIVLSYYINRAASTRQIGRKSAVGRLGQPKLFNKFIEFCKFLLHIVSRRSYLQVMSNELVLWLVLWL